MNKKTSRFLALEVALFILVLLLGQFFPFPIAGTQEVQRRVDKMADLFEYRVVVKADLKTSIVYILEINGQYCEKMFDRSLVFNRFFEKPLVLLRKVSQNQDAQFVARDSAKSHLYMMTEDEEMLILKQSQNDTITLAFSLFGGTVILLGMSFGTGTKKRMGA
jgi:hypothetical protein